ncbi:hypothetical protein HPB50_008680 [Hyalomma asiaticum]|uniref:Uncharacterized protein n=1 Tax=Hyalomma asiaticum TaxID=266040 RepID=A0ACB7RHE5_HYAAI|nr:hypothetical protein HPB50_008680 [Hyalomma asiaticum]
MGRFHNDEENPAARTLSTYFLECSHLANVVLRSKVVMKDVPLLPHRYKCGPLLQQLSNRLSDGWRSEICEGSGHVTNTTTVVEATSPVVLRTRAWWITYHRHDITPPFGHVTMGRFHNDEENPAARTLSTYFLECSHLANVVLRSKVVMEDVPLLPHRYKCGPLLQQLSNRLSDGWHKTMTTRRFVATILSVLWIDVMWTVVSTLGYFGSVIIKVPILESLIEAPNNRHRATSAMLFAAASVADLLFCSYQTHVSLRLCTRVRSMLQAAIFSKMTRLSPSALTRNPSGYVVSVLGVDCVQLSASALQFPLPMIGSLCMPLVLWVLALRAGTVPAIGCAVWLMVVLFLPFPTSVLQNTLWKRVTRFRDERLKSTADLLSSVRVVKLYAWEDAYLGTVGRLRDAELAALLRTNLLDGLMDSLYSSTSSMARASLRKLCC